LVTRATRNQREIWYMESGPSRVNAPLEGPVIPRSRRDLFKDQCFTRQGRETDQNGSVPRPRMILKIILCCFVLLEPTWMLYRVPRVSPGVTAPSSPPSRATPGPPLPYRPLPVQSARYYYPGLRPILGTIKQAHPRDPRTRGSGPSSGQIAPWRFPQPAHRAVVKRLPALNGPGDGAGRARGRGGGTMPRAAAALPRGTFPAAGRRRRTAS